MRRFPYRGRFRGEIRGWHFFLVYGYKVEMSHTLFYIHDPLSAEKRSWSLTFAELEAAMTAPGRYKNQGFSAYRKEQPVGKEYYLPDYLFGDGRIYEVRHSDGGQSRFQSQKEGNIYYQTKGEPIAEWEEMWIADGLIYRGTDTSAGERPILHDAGLRMAAMVRRGFPARWHVGGTYTRKASVHLYNKADGEPISSGTVTDTMTFVAHHATFTGYDGVSVRDVIELQWNQGESYFYARGWGLVGWGRMHNDPHTPQNSRISEVHAPGARPDNVREKIARGA